MAASADMHSVAIFMGELHMAGAGLVTVDAERLNIVPAAKPARAQPHAVARIGLHSMSVAGLAVLEPGGSVITARYSHPQRCSGSRDWLASERRDTG